MLKHSPYLHPKTDEPDAISDKQYSQVEKVQETTGSTISEFGVATAHPNYAFCLLEKMVWTLY